MTPKEFRDIRHTLKLSQGKLSRIMNIRPETVSRAERGAKPISRKMAQRLLDIAGIAKCPTCGQPVPPQCDETHHRRAP